MIVEGSAPSGLSMALLKALALFLGRARQVTNPVLLSPPLELPPVPLDSVPIHHRLRWSPDGVGM
jgi:hypothetical protein